MHRKAFTLLLLASLWTAASPAAAARWTPIGPADGAVVLSLALDPVDPSIAYAGLDGGGVYRSTDGGRTWSPASFGLGLDNSLTIALAVSPGEPRNVYAGTPGGVYLSRNGGLTWQRSLASPPVYAIVINPLQPSRVYAGTANGMFSSEDGGLHWASFGQSARPIFERRFRIEAMAIDPVDPQTLYVSYFGAATRMYKTVDGGSTWEKLRREWVLALAIDPHHPQTLYAAGYRKVLKSTDGGRSWTAVIGRQAYAVAVDPSVPDTVYVGDESGVLVSRDAGATWQRSRIPDRLPFVVALAPDPASPGTVLAGTFLAAGGIYRSEDAAASWRPTGEALINTPISSLAAAPGGSPLFAAGPRGIYRTHDSGATWEKLLGEGPGVVALLPSHPQTVYAELYAPDGPVFRSTDGGETWVAASTGLPFQSVQSLVIDPSDPLRLYVVLEEDGRLFRSLNGGATWAPLGLIAGKLAIDPTRPQTLYVTRGEDVYRSRDGGATWGRVMTGGVPTLDAHVLKAIAIAPSDPDVVAVADSRFVFATYDGGRTWSRLRGLEDAATLEFDPQDARVLYVGGPGSLLRTLDGGATWERFTLGLYGLSVLDLAFDPADPARLWAATSGAGVFAIDLR